MGKSLCENCYFYEEIRDMGAHVSVCAYYGESGKCPCSGCTKYIDRHDAVKIVKDHVDQPGNAKIPVQDQKIPVDIQVICTRSVSDTFMVSESEIEQFRKGDNPFEEELMRMADCNDMQYEYCMSDPETGETIATLSVS